eukprot:TRINITY_DN38765_c0_g1_i1.p1 TRINITY_DN38765_c0_g1~~TRINITY_DN38765_c0_g1_i1.p1  ORF type:complete len:792 (-),score=106.23 TRINITY_DN38765_c0_g1_i1:39-2414(-)
MSAVFFVVQWWRCLRWSPPSPLVLLAATAAPLMFRNSCGVSAQRIREYNLWVCPHCERGVKVADVSDLSCESDGVSTSTTHWPTVKQSIYNFLQGLTSQPTEQTLAELQPLVELANGGISGECYMGVMSMGFLSHHFMDRAERRDFFQTTFFGGVPYNRAVPISYWDVYLSRWPLFGILASVAQMVRHDARHVLSGQATADEAVLPNTGITGIDLSPRKNEDFQGGISAVDEDFMGVLLQNLGPSTSWVKIRPPVPMQVSLRYLAETAHVNCSWGRATAYFALAEALLSVPGGPSRRVLNSTREFMLLGEHNLNRCSANTTVFHHMLSAWPFWLILGRLEQRLLSVELEAYHPVGPAATAAVDVAAGEWTPPALPVEGVRLKWRHLTRGGVSREAAAASTVDRTTSSPSRPSPTSQPVVPDEAQACIDGSAGLAHVALSADTAQIDGLIVALNSATINAGANASRLCFHAFALPHQLDFVAEALSCAFGGNMTVLATASNGNKVAGASSTASYASFDTSASYVAFKLRGAARLLLHALEPRRVWRAVGVLADNESASSVEIVDTEDRGAQMADTGNLGAVHNFARFVLHELLPALPRVVYLDVDIVVRADLCELYDTPALASPAHIAGDGGATIAAVRRTHQPLRVYVDVLQPAVPTWVPGEAPSFNAGVMVIDLDRWRSRGASRLVAEWVAANRRTRLWRGASQPPLLLLFYDEVAPLHWGWNVDGLGHRLNYPKDVLNQAKVLHWTGPLKPWRHHGVNRLLWEPYALEYCHIYSFREHTTTCRPDSWFC